MCLSIVSFGAKKIEKGPPLPEKYQKWLSEEVVYIITAVEKHVFLQLKDDREREAFITAFWRQRNPNPNAPQNEFKTEHYRRIQYANHWFGRESPAPGWRCDMGRIYILLGEPNHIEKFENESDVYPTIIWNYQGKPGTGLPGDFNVVFFKKDGVGEYELYSPVKNGPQQLIPNYEGDMTNYGDAYVKLLNLQPDVANTSLSLIPGEPVTGSPSIPSELLIRQKIPQVPEKTVSSSYAEKLLRYKDVVEVEYTSAYIDSECALNVIHDPMGLFFVHYLIEPKILTMEASGGHFYTTLEIWGTVSDEAGNVILQINKILPIDLNQQRMDNIKDKLFSFQDSFPLIPGKYHCNILLKNRTSKEFTSMEKEFIIPVGRTPMITVPILANRVSRNSAPAGTKKAYLINDTQLLISPRNDFASRDTLTIFFQVLNLDPRDIEKSVVVYDLFRKEEKLKTWEKPLKGYGDLLGIQESFPLQDLSPSYYRLHITIQNGQKIPLLVENGDFYISPLSVLPRPWVASLPVPASDFPQILQMIGNEYSNKKDYDQAQHYLSEASAKSPDSAKIAFDYCQVLLLTRQYQKVLEVSTPLAVNLKKYELLAVMGQACQKLGNLEAAITHYNEYLNHFGANLTILNTLGDLLSETGRTEEALKVYQKSLEINQNQESVRNKIKKMSLAPK